MNVPHVLLSAYHCAPGRGSVSQIGWEWYSRLSREVKLTLVTHSRNRDALTQAGAPFAQSEIIYIDTEWFAGPLYRLASRLFKRSEHAVFLLSSLDFFVYDAVAVRRLRKSRTRFSVAHAVTPVSPLAVTRLHKLEIPLILGPLNGGMTTPGTFRQTMRKDSQWFYGVRSIGRLFNVFAGCYRKAVRVLSATAATDRCLPAKSAIERMIENGVDLHLFRPAALPAPSSQTPLEILFVGRLIPAKGIDMLLEAAARVQHRLPIRITIAGEGTLRQTFQQQAADLGLTSIVTFTGHQNLEQVAQLMSNSHLFCLPSIRESGGAVLLEAMASGLPLLGVAHGGPGELIDNDVGRALPPDGPESLINGMAAAFEDFFEHPAAWQARGLAGRQRAESVYGWPGRIQRMVHMYNETAGEWNGVSTIGNPDRKSREHSPERSSAQHPG